VHLVGEGDGSAHIHELLLSLGPGEENYLEILREGVFTLLSERRSGILFSPGRELEEGLCGEGLLIFTRVPVDVLLAQVVAELLTRGRSFQEVLAHHLEVLGMVASANYSTSFVCHSEHPLAHVCSGGRYFPDSINIQRLSHATLVLIVEAECCFADLGRITVLKGFQRFSRQPILGTFPLVFFLRCCSSQ